MGRLHDSTGDGRPWINIPSPFGDIRTNMPKANWNCWDSLHVHGQVFTFLLSIGT